MITFRKLDGDIPRPHIPVSALDKWYDSVRDDALDSLSSRDLARACRQQLFLEAVVPIAIDNLSKDLIESDDYADELAIGLVEIPDNFWARHVVLLSKLESGLEKVIDILDIESQERIEERLEVLRTLKTDPNTN